MNNKRYWLRGGLTLVTIYLVVSVLEIVFINDSLGPFHFRDDYLLFLNPGIFLVGMSAMGGHPTTNQFIIAGIVAAVIIGSILFCVGAFFGRFYGKIKNRNVV